MTPNQVDVARRIAELAHAGQFRRDGKTPYIKHPIDVAQRVLSLKGLGMSAVCIALLHDVLEDTAWTSQDLLLFGVSYMVVNNVRALTREKGTSEKAYLTRLMQYPIARAVKLADMDSNLADSPTEKQREKYVRYRNKLLS